MDWFNVGFWTGILISSLYIISLFIERARNVYIQTIFDNTIYGDILKDINDGINKDEEIPEALLVMFVFSIITIFIGVLIFLICLLTSYLALLAFILTSLLFLQVKENK